MIPPEPPSAISRIVDARDEAYLKVARRSRIRDGALKGLNG
jgi:hypothetical protein